MFAAHEDVLKIHSNPRTVPNRCTAMTPMAHTGAGSPSGPSPASQSPTASRMERGNRSMAQEGTSRSMAYRSSPSTAKADIPTSETGSQRILLMSLVLAAERVLLLEVPASMTVVALKYATTVHRIQLGCDT
jgi:hypothetical protein